MKPFEELLLKYDDLATRAKTKFETKTWTTGIWLGVGAVAVFAFLVAFSQSLYPYREVKYLALPLLEVALVVGSWYLLAKRANQNKADFLKKRHLAEYLRMNHALAKLQLPISYTKKLYKDDDFEVVLPEEVKVDIESYQPEEIDLHDAKIGLNTFIESQKKYHTDTRIEGYEAKEHRIHTLLNIILYVFLFLIVSKLGIEVMDYFHVHFIHENHWLLNVCIFFVILLPPVYAALEGIVFFSEWKRNIEISKKLTEKYNIVQEKVNSSNSLEELKMASIEVQKTFWQDQLDWVKWFENKKVEARV